jgi:hypothetical protein
MKYQLEDSAAVADDLAASDFPIGRLADFVGHALAGEGIFRRANE